MKSFHTFVLVCTLALGSLPALGGGFTSGGEAQRLFENLQGPDVVERTGVTDDGRIQRVRRNSVIECSETVAIPQRNEVISRDIVDPESPDYSCQSLLPADPCRDPRYRSEAQCG